MTLIYVLLGIYLLGIVFFFRFGEHEGEVPFWFRLLVLFSWPLWIVYFGISYIVVMLTLGRTK